MKINPEFENNKIVFYNKQGTKVLLPKNVEIQWYLDKGFTLRKTEEIKTEEPVVELEKKFKGRIKND